MLAGHVDSTGGPAVFFRLRDVRPAIPSLVTRADGSTVRFTVTRVARYAKTAFPTAEVYGPTPGAELRLITCGGDFDRAARSYRDNVVVYARTDASARLGERASAAAVAGAPAGGVPVPPPVGGRLGVPGVEVGVPGVRGPGHDVRRPGADLLVAARAAVGLAGRRRR